MADLFLSGVAQSGAGGGLATTDIDTIAELESIVADVVMRDASALFNAGALPHERGGLEADISAYAGAVGVRSGSTEQLIAVSQIKQSSTSTEASTATAIPADDTKPTTSEGADVGVSISITPTSSSHRFLVSCSLWLESSTNPVMTLALFDSNVGTDAINAISGAPSAGGFAIPFAIVHDYLPGNTTARTLTLRFGASSGTTYMNRAAGGGLYGGANLATISVIEYLP